VAIGDTTGFLFRSLFIKPRLQKRIMVSPKNSQSTLIAATGDMNLADRWVNILRGTCRVIPVSNFNELQTELHESKPSIVFLDLDLPDFDRTTHYQRLFSSSPFTRIVAFSDRYDEEEALTGLKAGIRGYMHRETDRGLLKKVVEVVQKGEIWVSRDMVNRLVGEITSGFKPQEEHSTEQDVVRMTQPRVPINQLTTREQQIAYLIANASSNKEIASMLKISESTVKAHLSAIYHKLGLLDRLSLALFVSRQMKNNAPASELLESKM
jgi:DNA-binding NarL/FixJ family response regulator